MLIYSFYFIIIFQIPFTAGKPTLMHGNKAKLKRPSLALLRCESKFGIFELGLIAVQIGLALLPCTTVFKIRQLRLKIRVIGKLGIRNLALLRLKLALLPTCNKISIFALIDVDFVLISYNIKVPKFLKTFLKAFLL